MKFVLLVEGDTEKETAAEFLKRWLDPQLTKRIGIQVVRFSGYGELARKIVTKARMYLDGPHRDEVVAVIGLLDLYGPNFYPDHLATAKDRHDWAVAYFQKAVDRPAFRMFFAVHEFEAWLLSQPEHFPRVVKEALTPMTLPPEQVNFTEPPAKLLDRIYKQKQKRNYKKTTYGKQLFAKLDPKVAVMRCPHLKAMLDEMLELARKAGQ